MSGRSLLAAAVLLISVAGGPGWFREGTLIAAAESPSAATSLEAAETSANPARPAQPPTDEPQALPVDRPLRGAEVKGREPRVLLIMVTGDKKCDAELAKLRRPGGPFAAMVARGWKIGEAPDNHVQIVERERSEELVKQFQVREFPTVACIADGQIIRSFKDGCTTPLDQWTFGWLISGKNERPPTAVSEPARVASTGHYRLRGNHWSVDGDWSPARTTVISHLRSPVHGYRIPGNWRIEDWSYEELRSYHDDLHESEQPTATTGATSRSSSGTRWPKDFSSGIKR